MRYMSRRILAILLAVLMVFGLTNNLVSAQPKEPNGQKSQAEALKELFSSKMNKKDTKEYNEGEAVVMFKASEEQTSKAKDSRVFDASKVTNELTALAGCTIDVKNTYTFKKSGKTASGRDINGTDAAMTLQVSLLTAKGMSTKKLIEVIKSQYTNVVAVEPNYIMHATGADNYKAYQWALDNQGQYKGTAGQDINPEDIWTATTEAKEKVVAVIDSGIDYTHEALQGRIWENTHTDKIKGEHGYDFCNMDADPIDDFGHGSHCAGIIAGNGTGITGVAKNVKLMALKFLDDTGSGDLFAAVGAYDYIYRAVNLGVDIVAVNNSWSGGGGSEIMERLVDIVGEKGVISVVSAGNAASNNDEIPAEPWAFSSDYKISVAAITEKGELANFSSYGEKTVDIGAPGVDILSSVSYDVYNPTIHSREGQEDYSQLYMDFGADTLPEGHKEFAINADTMEQVENPVLEVNPSDTFGLKTDTTGCMDMVVKGNGEKLFGTYWPVTLPQSTTDYYASMMIKDASVYGEDGNYVESQVIIGIAPMEQLDGIAAGNVNVYDVLFDLEPLGMDDGYVNRNFWRMVSGRTDMRASGGDSTQYGMYVIGLCYGEGNGTCKISMDNIGVSKQNLKADALGKYDFYNGTSMAAPHVTGSVALLSQSNNSLSAMDLREKATVCARIESGIDGYVNGGKNLDLSKYEKEPTTIASVYYQEGKVVVKGSGLTAVDQITVNDKKIDILSKTNRAISFSGEGLVNKSITLTMTLWDLSVISKQEYISYNEQTIMPYADTQHLYSGSLVSDGTSLFYYGDGTFTSYDVANDTGEWNTLPCIDNTVVDDKGITGVINNPAAMKGDLAYDNHRIYALAETTSGYAYESGIVVYDIASQEWSKLCELPDGYMVQDTVGSTLAVYNNKLYLLGGYDMNLKTGLSTVYSYSLSKHVWVKEASLPESRLFAKANVVKGKLVLSFGSEDGSSNQSVPHPLILSGTDWTVSKADCTAAINSSTYNYNTGEDINYFDISTGLCSKGLVYAGLVTDQYGDIFFYDPEKDTYEASGNLSIYPTIKEGYYSGAATVANQFCFLGKGEEREYYDPETDFTYTDVSTRLFGMDMDTGFFQIQGDTSTCKYIGCGYYLPGESAEITILPADGYIVTGYMLDGKSYEGTTVTIDSVNKNYEITPIVQLLVQSIGFERSEYEVRAGERVTLDATITPEGAKADLLWDVDSDDSTIKDGVLTASTKDANKTLTVTVMTEDEMFYGTCKVKVLSTTQSIKLNQQNISLLKGGSCRIVATVQPADAINAQLRFSSSNPSVAMVNDSGEVVGLKAGKATITITTITGKKITTACKVTVIAPAGKVSALKAAAEPYKVKLSWGKTNGDGYTIYRYDSKQKKDVCIATVTGAKNTTYTVQKLLGSKGSKLAPGTAYTFRVASFVKVNGKKYYSGKVSIATVTKPLKTSIVKAVYSKKGKVTVTWKKITKASGYELYLSNKPTKNFKLKATIKKGTTVSTTIVKLKKGTYYVKIRTYKTVNGKKVFSTYSKVKKVYVK